MSASVKLFPTSDKLPSELCLDTSFVIEVYFTPDNPSLMNKRKTSCDELFSKILAETDAEKRTITTTVHGEVIEKIIEYNVCKHLDTNARIKYGARQIWREYYKANRFRYPDLKRTIDGEIEKFHQWQGDNKILTLPFKYNPGLSIITSEQKALFLEIAEYCKRFRILPSDARIIIEARHRGINQFVSLDSDFKNVDGITVYSFNKDK
jgi:predicted nucleic acid-binding protein